MARGKRRADGSLRPCVVRYRDRKNGRVVIAHADLVRFRALSFSGGRIWNSFELRGRLECSIAGLAALLEERADEHRWLKLRDEHGVVRAIGLPRNHPGRTERSVMEHREQMLDRIHMAAATRSAVA